MDLSFERILDNIHNQIAVIDCNQNLIYSNNLFESLLLLYNTEILDLKQRSIEELFVKDLSPVKEAVQSCLRKGEFIKTRFNFLYFGRLSYFSITVIPEYGRSGTVARCILILQNDTEVELGKRELKSRVLFFSSLIKKLPIGVYQFDQNDSDLTISLWNPYMAGIFNKSESELMQQPLSSVFDDATMKRHTKMIQKIRETRLYYEYPAEYIRTPEGMRYFHTILTPIDENKEGPPDSFLGIMTDVTEKIENDLELKQYQRELKTALKSKSEELKDTSALFMSIMESTYGIDIFALNTEMKYLAFNAHHQIMMQSNYGLEIEIGKSFIPVLDILNDKKITALFDDALEGKSTVTEIKLTLPDGTISYMDAVFSPLKSLDVIIGLTVVGLETSQLRELEKEAATFKKIAESAEYGVLLTDRDYNIQFINQFMLKILQIEGAAPVGENLSSYIPHDQFEFIQLHAQMDSSQKKTGHIEIEIQPSEKAPASLLATVSPYESKDGESGGISFTCIDITPLKEASIALEAARNKAEKASIMKSSFVANMSHEIRTPLNAILGFAQLMKEQLDNPQMEIYLKNILSSGDILRSLINDILDFSKIEAGKMDINPEQVNMIEFFQEIYSLFELKAADKKLDLKILSIGAVPEYLETDPLRLRQILLNLVSNTIKFTHWGSICIYMTVREDRMIIEVSDTGIGIPEQELNDIFHPFEQQDKQDARHFEGTGLGLSIVYKLVKLMGGSIHVTSDLWKGSCFTLNLPAVYAKETSRKTFAYKKEPVLDTELICLTEESYLNDRLKTAGKEYNIHFLPLSGTKTKKGTETNKTVLVLAHHPIRDTLVNGCIHIPLIPADRLQNNNKKPEYYFIREDLEADKTAAILFSIFQREHKSDSSPLLPYNSLSETGRQALLKAVNSCNFNDIEELLPHLGSCGEKGKKLAEQLKKGTADFDIPMVKKILEQIGNEISGGT